MLLHVHSIKVVAFVMMLRCNIWLSTAHGGGIVQTNPALKGPFLEHKTSKHDPVSDTQAPLAEDLYFKRAGLHPLASARARLDKLCR